MKYPYHFYTYGSRVKGTAKKYSDLDLCYKEEIDCYEVEEVKDKLEKSDLSFIVKVVGWNNIRHFFQKSIEKDLTLVIK
ncbi:MAG: hypothetical protein AD073_000029 [Mycoplasmataceae bacterium]|nr:MAG: hypothetical protein AD073_000029 [Mycoplasmataceae bacterium]